MVVRCSGCKRYIDKADVFQRIGISAFCSQACVDTRIRKASRTKKKRAPMTSELHDAVIMRDEFRCRYCGRFTDLHVHHIKYRSEGGPDEETNLITLCSEHHDLMHSNKRKWQPLLLELIEHGCNTGDAQTTVRAFATRQGIDTGGGDGRH